MMNNKTLTATLHCPDLTVWKKENDKKNFATFLPRYKWILLLTSD